LTPIVCGRGAPPAGLDLHAQKNKWEGATARLKHRACLGLCTYCQQDGGTFRHHALISLVFRQSAVPTHTLAHTRAVMERLSH
jgi:hypothetical protein